MRSVAFTLLALAALSGCTRKLVGNGNFINESRPVGKFNAVETDGSFNVVLTGDTANAIQVLAESNVLPEITTDVLDGALVIGYKNDMTDIQHGDVLIKVPARNVKSVSLAGSGSISSTDTLRNDKLDVSLLGSGKIQLSLSGASLTTILSGSGDVVLKGHVNSHKLSISGSGNVHAYDLKSSISKIEISGSGDAEVNADQILESTISGSGKVRYEGTPAITSNITGSGNVKAR